MDMSFIKNNLPSIIVALLGGLLIFFTTPWGIGVSPDSVSYLGSSKNLLSGLGLTIPFGDPPNSPLTHLAPLYPALISFVALLTNSVDLSARILNAVIFSTTLLLVAGLINQKITDHPLITFLAVTVVFASPIMIELHLMAWSEPLFLALILGSFIFLAKYLQAGQPQGLVWAALLAALGLLTRYAGAAVIAASGLVILIFSSHPFRRRFIHALVYGLLAILPFAAWSMRNYIVAGTATNREVAFHLINTSQISQAIDTLIGFISMPAGLPIMIKLSLSLLMLGLIPAALFWRLKTAHQSISIRSLRENIPAEINILLIFIPVYLLFLAFSISFFDANTPLDYRILSPIFPAWIILIASSASQLWNQPKAWMKIVIAGFFVILVGSYLLPGFRLLSASYTSGLGFNQRAWRDSALISHLRSSYSDSAIYSNVPEGIFLHTGIPAISLPRQFFAVSQSENPAYSVQFEKMTAALHSGQAYLVMFSSHRADPALEKQLATNLALQPLQTFQEGTIYGFAPATGNP